MLAEHDQPSHSTHKNDGSIDVSSSIGVSHDGGGSGGAEDSGSTHTAGLVEDLLANESSMEGTMSGRLAPINPAGLSHAVVVDSESDLMGAESDSKFSFSKLKKPVCLSFSNLFKLISLILILLTFIQSVLAPSVRFKIQQ